MSFFSRVLRHCGQVKVVISTSPSESSESRMLSKREQSFARAAAATPGAGGPWRVTAAAAGASLAFQIPAAQTSRSARRWRMSTRPVLDGVDTISTPS